MSLFTMSMCSSARGRRSCALHLLAECCPQKYSMREKVPGTHSTDSHAQSRRTAAASSSDAGASSSGAAGQVPGGRGSSRGGRGSRRGRQASTDSSD
eukprot:6198028-Pleurochrysis_carterae.AAC.6